MPLCSTSERAAQNNAVMAARRESLTDIRNNNPDLALSGNIISATFNIPHTLDYRKGADWVRRIVSRSTTSTTNTRNTENTKNTKNTN